MTPEEQAAKAMEALDRSITWNRQLLDERNRYKRALEKMVIPGSGMSCTCGVCYICIALDALRVSDEPGRKT